MSLLPASSWNRKVVAEPKSSQCGLCGLSKGCFSPKMKPSGKGKRKILFVGEAPGEQEDRQGTQFVGKAGQLLRGFLEDIGVDLDDCWITNAVTCRPPENKIDPKYIKACRPALLQAIQELQPEVIIPLGKSAVESLITPLWKKGVDSISKWVGWTIPCHEYNAWVCPVFHPSYVLRSDGDQLLELIFKEQLLRAVSLHMEGIPRTAPTLADLQSEVEIITQEGQAKKRLRELLKCEGQLAWDYETTGLKPERVEQRIVSVSFCLDGEDTFAIPFTKGVRRLVSKILRKPKLLKIASNLKFEERWTRAKLGHGVVGWHWDTMLAAHCIDNRSGITSIKFQAFVYLGISDYSSHVLSYLKGEGERGANNLNRINDINQEDLLLYNGLDSLLEYHVAQRQMEALR